MPWSRSGSPPGGSSPCSCRCGGLKRASSAAASRRGIAGGGSMIEAPVLIVGGGPAGSSCAWSLGQRRIDSIVLDAESFPRTKLCAGWITPQVLEALHIDADAYPRGIVRLEKLHVEYFAREAPWIRDVASAQYSIRRYEFDDWLLKRSGASVFQHAVRRIERDGDLFVVDGQFRAKYLVGAGGTSCPVFRTLFKAANPRSREYQVAAIEEEFEYAGALGDCQLWLGEHGL